MVVVTADDLGLSAAVDRGIIAAYRDGIVRSTSLLVTLPGSEAGAALAREERGLEIGLHIDLVEGRPAADPSRVPSLVGAEGAFLGLGTLVRRVALGRVRAAEVAAELRAQVARARSLGTPALAWDSHRHAHLLPPIARVVAAVAREEGVRWVRRAGAPPAARPWTAKAGLLALATARCAPLLRGIAGNDWFVDLTMLRPRTDAAARLGLLARLPGVGELSAHPGAPADGGDDPLAAARPLDLALVTDPAVRRAVGEGNVRWRVT